MFFWCWLTSVVFFFFPILILLPFNLVIVPLVIGLDAGKDWRQKEKGVAEDDMDRINSMDLNLSKFPEIAEDRGAWRALVHELSNSQTRLSNWTPRAPHGPLSDLTALLSVSTLRQWRWWLSLAGWETFNGSHCLINKTETSYDDQDG